MMINISRKPDDITDGMNEDIKKRFSVIPSKRILPSRLTGFITISRSAGL